MMKYVSWIIDGDKAHNPTEGITIILTDGEFPWWGWWPSPSEPESVIAGSVKVKVVTGSCLFDSRWGVKFKHPKPGQEGTWRSLALRSGRDKIRELLARGREIEHITVPTFPTPYVKKMLSFQRLGLEKLGDVVEQVLYHVPLNEYFCYCSTFPSPWRKRMEQTIRKEAEQMSELVRSQLAEWRPKIHWGGNNPPQSFVDLYLRAIEDGETVIGLEELVELRLPLEASRQRGVVIPTLVGVLDIPHPYYLEKSQDEVIVIEL